MISDEAGEPLSPLSPGTTWLDEAVLLARGRWAAAGVLDPAFRIQGEGAARILLEEAERSHGRLEIRELAALLRPSESVDLSLGRRLLKWGTAYFRQPTDLAAPRRELGDPGDRLQRREGLEMVAADAFTATSSLNLVYLPSDENGRSGWGRQRLAARAYSLLGSIDASLVGRLDSRGPEALGANAAVVLGERWELHGELLWQSGNERLYPAGIRSTAEEDSLEPRPRPEDSLADWVVGVAFTPSEWNFLVEWSHAGDGLTGDEWDSYSAELRDLRDRLSQGDPAAASRFRADLAFFEPTRLRRDYLLLRAARSSASGLELELLGIQSIADGSALVIPTVRWPLGGATTLYVRTVAYAGSEDSEFGLVPRSLEWNVGGTVAF